MARAGTNVVILLMIALAICLFSSAVALKQGKWFDRIYIIVFDKLEIEKAHGDRSFATWASKGQLLNNYYSVGEGDQSNYISMIAGRTDEIEADESSRNLKGPTLIDLMEPTIKWKAYLEDYPGDCNAGDKIKKGRCGSSETAIRYVRTHNPFISFDRIRSRKERCANIVPATQLAEDASQNAVPEFNFYVPNQCHNGEEGVVTAGKHLNHLLTNTITRHAVSNRTLVVVTCASSPDGHPGKVFTALIPLGQMHRIPRPPASVQYFDHYSLLRTVEDNWNLGNLEGGDVKAKKLLLLWRKFSVDVSS